MIGLEIRVNGELIATAGRDDLSVLTANVMVSGKLGKDSFGTMEREDATECHFSVTGAGRENENGFCHLTWFRDKNPIQIGDEVSFRLVETDTVDAPSRALGIDDFDQDDSV